MINQKAIYIMFKMGRSTAEIANMTDEHEAKIYNSLHDERERLHRLDERYRRAERLNER